MLLRFVRMQVPEEKVADLRAHWENRVLPTLVDTPGCLYAALLRQSLTGDECVSVTFWTSAEAVDAYEGSGLFDQLLDETDPYLQSKEVWRSDVGGAARTPTPLPEPQVEAFEIGTPVREEGDDEVPPTLFVRTVNLRVADGKVKEFRRVWARDVLPMLREVPGCRDAFLVASVEGRDRVMSVTVWERDEDAVRYEASGTFRKISQGLQPYLADIEHWKLSLASDVSEQRHLLDIEGYRVIASRRPGNPSGSGGDEA